MRLKTLLEAILDPRNTCRALLRAARDAVRAWRCAPIWFADQIHEWNAKGGVSVRHQRRFSRRQRLGRKILDARVAFTGSWRAGTARTLRVPLLRSEGLLANVLHVLETLHRVRPDAAVHVDWVLTGEEIGFRYGRVGDDVWSQLFQPVGRRAPRSAYSAGTTIDYTLWGTGKEYLRGRALERHRQAYHATVAKWLRVDNQLVRERIRQLSHSFPPDCLRIGVHRRVGNPMVANLQRDGIVPPLHRFVATIEAILEAEGRPNYKVFLATDDAEAALLFKATYGDRLILQDAVQRTTADELEVHLRKWGQLSIADAVDVLVDAILLADCHVLVHVSSSVSTFAGLVNPDLTLVRVSVQDAAIGLPGYKRAAARRESSGVAYLFGTNELAPGAGLEPATQRLTAACSTD